MDERQGIFRSGARVLDLGAAPGSWTQYASKQIGPRGSIVALDLQPLDPRVMQATAHNTTVHQGDAFDPPPDLLRHPFDVVMSDMAPKTTGSRVVDQARSAALVERSLHMSTLALRPGGTWVSKVFHGPELDTLRQQARATFETVKLIKPRATRTESMELFLLGQGFFAAP